MRNNNPCNLRFAHQTKAEPGYNKFARFPTPEDGMRACLEQIGYDAGRGDTIATFIEDFAPSFENDTPLYIAQLAKCVGKKATTPLSKIHQGRLATCLVKKESSTIITP